MAHGTPDWVRMVQVVVTVENVPVVAEEATEYVIDTYGSYSGSSSTYEDLFNRTVPSDRKGILDKIELSCDNYAVALFKIVVKGVAIMSDERLPESFTKEFPGLQLKAGQQTLVQVKSDGATTIAAYCDVSYKEIG